LARLIHKLNYREEGDVEKDSTPVQLQKTKKSQDGTKADGKVRSGFLEFLVVGLKSLILGEIRE